MLDFPASNLVQDYLRSYRQYNSSEFHDFVIFSLNNMIFSPKSSYNQKFIRMHCVYSSVNTAEDPIREL